MAAAVTPRGSTAAVAAAARELRLSARALREAERSVKGARDSALPVGMHGHREIVLRRPAGRRIVLVVVQGAHGRCGAALRVLARQTARALLFELVFIVFETPHRIHKAMSHFSTTKNAAHGGEKPRTFEPSAST